MSENLMAVTFILDGKKEYTYYLSADTESEARALFKEQYGSIFQKYTILNIELFLME